MGAILPDPVLTKGLEGVLRKSETLSHDTYLTFLYG